MDYLSYLSLSSALDDSWQAALRGTSWGQSKWKPSASTAIFLTIFFSAGSASPVALTTAGHGTHSSYGGQNNFISTEPVPVTTPSDVERIIAIESISSSTENRKSSFSPIDDFTQSPKVADVTLTTGDLDLATTKEKNDQLLKLMNFPRQTTVGLNTWDEENILSFVRGSYIISASNSDAIRPITPNHNDAPASTSVENEILGNTSPSLHNYVSRDKTKGEHGLDEELKVAQNYNQPQLIEIEYDPEVLDMELSAPPTAEELRKIQQFDPSNLNYTALRLIIDHKLDDLNNKMQGRSSVGESSTNALLMPALLGNMDLQNVDNLGNLRHLSSMVDMKTVIKEIETSIMTSVSCNTCFGAVGLLQHYIEQGSSKEDMIRAASKLCSVFKVETPRVCHGIINIMSEELVYVMTHLVMEPKRVCGLLIGEVCGVPHDPYHTWRVLFPPYPKPPLQLVSPPKDSSPTLKVLHLSDTHYDPYYLEGSNADCSEPMCCRRTSGPPANEGARAGKWGDYRKCDTPERTINSMLRNIAQEHPDVDYILWTGDLPPHDIWNQSRASNLRVLRDTVQQLASHFPHTVVFPALGNHESAPVNSFPPPSIPPLHSADWLYTELDREWGRHWLPPTTSATIRKGGYYAVQLMPGLKIISLNMNYCNNKNWWLLLDSDDPADQLQWLVYELQAAELRGDKVHILGHIPPGYHDCLAVWSSNFYDIINRFESTVSGQFYGHTHFDEFELFYAEEGGRHRAMSVAYVAPSVTTYYGLNPGYRLYYVEHGPGGHYRVMDHETWVMDLDEANHPRNSFREPRWFPLYSARRAYSLPSLLPADWDDLVDRMLLDQQLFDKFYSHYWKNSSHREPCDDACRGRILCDLRSGSSSDRQATCSKLLARRGEGGQQGGTWRSWLVSAFTVSSLATLFLWL